MPTLMLRGIPADLMRRIRDAAKVTGTSPAEAATDALRAFYMDQEAKGINAAARALLRQPRTPPGAAQAPPRRT